MDPDTQAYYQHRAEEQLELAQQADKAAVVSAHYQLAELYLARLFPGEDAPEPVGPARG